MAKTHQRNKTVPTRTYPVFLSYLKGSDLQKLVQLVVKVRIFTTKCTLLYDIGNVGVKGVKNILVSLSSQPNSGSRTQTGGPYKFNAGNVTIQHQGATVGVVAVPKRKAGILSTKRINVEVSLSSSAISGSNLGSELSNGVLTLNSVARLTGKSN
ncbi:hypothetical protein ACE6H2_025415 [Prunus campanulata]